MTKPTPTPTVVIFLTRDGVREVQVHSPNRRAESEGHALYERVRPVVDRLDRLARRENTAAQGPKSGE